MLERVFEGEGVPVELLNVAAVESRFDPNAVSPAGARGMWQFMGSTARSYGLRVSGKVDERFDPVRSTTAAAKHLRDLFLSYNDWHLALAAYNAGIGTINKLLNRGGSMDFWQLARDGQLSGETARFVPRVIALTMIVQDPDLYGFSPVGLG
jgi:membrane-bound lytic murein transglycosylase D